MPSYLERYRQGKCEEVWAELLALGSQIRKQPLYTEAQAVARVTMARARMNIELLVPRLTSLGYRFAHPDRVFIPANEETRRFVDEIERRAGPLPLSLRAWCDVVGDVNFMGAHPKLSTYIQCPQGQQVGQSFLSLFEKHGGAAATSGNPLEQSVAVMQRLLQEVVQGINSGQPHSPEVAAGVRASKELLDGFRQPLAEGPDVESDPLVVEPYFGDLEDSLNGEGDQSDEPEMDESDSYNVVIAPDSTHKTGHSGGGPYLISFPDSAVDAPLQGHEDYGTFIEYLRLCFRWGGFPGLRASAKPPREELEHLTQGLMPL